MTRGGFIRILHELAPGKFGYGSCTLYSVSHKTNFCMGGYVGKQTILRYMGFTFAPTLIACLAWAVKSYNMQQSNAVTASPVRSYKAAAARFPSPVLLFLPYKSHMCRRVLKQLFSVSRSPVPPFSAVAACVFSI